MRSPFLWLALALHCALATGYAWCTPGFEGPDENSHYRYAWAIANTHRLPLPEVYVKEHGLPQTDGAELGHHPPLYYATVAAGMLAIDIDDSVPAPRVNQAFGAPDQPSRHLHFLHEAFPRGALGWLRMISVALGAITILCVHRLGRRCCPDAPRVADLAALLVACLPMFSFLHGVLNNDVLATTLASATLLQLVAMLQAERVGIRQGLWLGTLLGLALMTKLTTLFLLGLAGVVALVLLARRRTDWRTFATALAAVLAIAGWWFVRNLSLFGDPLAMSVHDEAFQPIPEHLRWPYLLGIDPWPDGVPSFWPTVFRSLLGRFGWFTVQPSPVLVWSGAAVAGLAVLGTGRALFDRHRRFRPHTTWLLLLAALLVLGGTAWFNLRAPQPQGRLLFPAIAPVAVLLAAGLCRLTDGLPFRRFALALLPIAAGFAFFATFRPALDPDLAPAPADHRSIVRRFAGEPARRKIAWRSGPFERPLASAPELTWHDPGAPAGTRYSLYAFDDSGRIWLATHEWTGGGVAITGDRLHTAEVMWLGQPLWSYLPRDVPLNLRLRRVPSRPEQRPSDLPASDVLRLTRS